MSEAVESMRRDEHLFEAVLATLPLKRKGKSIQCPWHEDQNPSASAKATENGVYRVSCHACGKFGDVFDLRALNGGPSVEEQLREIGRAEKQERKPAAKSTVMPSLDACQAAYERVGTIKNVFKYQDPDTQELDLVVFRIHPHGKPEGDKTFRQASQCQGGWLMESPPTPWPIYNRARVRSAQSVVVVEGEKCVHALHDLGIVATSSPCGAGKAGMADWSMLAGKDVILWPDNDTKTQAGVKHMRDVQRILDGLNPLPRLSWVDPQGLGLPGDGGDCCDLIAMMGDGAAKGVRAVLDMAQPLGASRELIQLLEDTISGKRKSIAWPWILLTQLSRSLMPGTVTIICGDAGCGKSFLLMEAAAHWHGVGERVALMEVEEDRTYHMRRALAQVAANARLFDDEWVAGNPAEVREAASYHRNFLDDFGRCIFDCPKQPQLDMLADWVEERAKAGCRLIIVDPVTAAAQKDKPWSDDLAFIMRVKTVAKDHGASVVLAIHPKKGQRDKEATMDDMAGGAAYQRLAQTVLWLEAFDEYRSADIGGKTLQINRRLRILKSRNGPGRGVSLGYEFRGRDLRFIELGAIDPKQPKEPQSRKRHNSEPQDSEDLYK